MHAKQGRCSYCVANGRKEKKSDGTTGERSPRTACTCIAHPHEYICRVGPNKLGLDTVQFVISTNKGQALDNLEKVVSGGELSRIGLAIQVISSRNNDIATMIFDEVDSGISGSTASVVGQLLRKLGDSAQVICVTHLPQVAARAHNQMFVTKFSDKKTTETHMICLQESERIEELARLLAGDTLTESAIANARELLQISNS